MKRRRHSLQVSTFPFLAVLLCAMGSLILLLLVIDRRAKVVMRAKALAAIRQMEAEDAKDSGARAAEWEQRRRALHEKLQQQRQELQNQSATAERQLDAAIHEFQTEQAQIPALEHQLQAEKDNLLRQERAVASALQEAKQKREQSQATSAELTRLSGELLKLEQTLDDIKTLRQRQQQTYSLVPYRGRRGDNRQPIYLECAKESLIFHPDRMTLAATDSSGSAVLDEVERRIKRRQPTSGSESAKEGTPYLLLLVRPNGIVTYYRTLAALRNLKVDFGYEFVESDWVLDFPRDDKATQPWMMAGAAPSQSEGHKPREPAQRSPEPAIAQGGRQGPNAWEGGELAAGPPGLSGSPGNVRMGGGDTGTGRETRGQVGNSPPQLQGLPGFPDSGDLYRLRHFASLPTSMGIDRLQKPGETAGNGSWGGGNFSTSPTISGALQERSGTPGVPKPGGSNFAVASGSGGRTESDDQQRGGSVGTGSSCERGELSPGVLASPQSAATPFSRDPIVERSPSGANASPFSNANSRTRMGPIPSEGADTSSRPARDSNLLSSKPLWPNGAAANGSSLANSAGAPSASSLLPHLGAPPSHGPGQSGSLAGGANRTQSSDPEEAGPETGSSSGLGQVDGPPQKKSSAAPVVHRYVGREWNIFIECGADHVIVYPGGSQVPATALAGRKNPQDRSLLQVIQQMIAHRQALIASSEAFKDSPTQSPQIRFLVRPNGLRTYFLAYPELAPLHLSMTRENLDANEDVVRHMMGR
jgi:hypothetical protein